jgi:hypothetical protein
MSKSHVALSVTACFVIAAPAATGADNSYDGAYSGERRLTKGAGPSCIKEENVTAVASGATLKFTNSQLKDYVISFKPRSDGSFEMTHEDMGGDVVDIHGHVTLTAIDADVVDYSSRCEHHWHLTKKPQ